MSTHLVLELYKSKMHDIRFKATADTANKDKLYL